MKIKQASLLSLFTVIVLFLFYLFFPSHGDMGVSFLVYGICMIHICVVLFNKWFRGIAITRSVHVCNLAMLTISCFSLNQEFQLFAPFADWVNLLLISMFVVMLIEEFIQINSPIWAFIYACVVTIGLSVVLYFNAVLLPVFYIGIIGIIVFGLGIHLFVPAIVMISSLYYLVQRRSERGIVLGAVFGILLAVASSSYVLFKINEANQIVEKVNVDFATNEENQLPKWVYVSEQIPVNFWTEMVIVGDFKYELFSEWFMERGIGNGNSMDDQGIHDPFLNLAKLLGIHKVDLSDEERLSILKANFNKRHQTNRKLWSGEHLETTQCITDVKLYPAYRLAYTQKTFFIKNTSENNFRSEEALYTLQLPNDAVVTSMSLWVNGQERKSYLTTKEKADSAYVEIVGVQNRDPALLHWQEGNKVTVTVFPCNSNEVRMLKVGFTSPLMENSNRLFYHDIFVEGPSLAPCKQSVSISFDGNELPITSEGISLKKNISRYEANFKGDKEWEIGMDKIPLAKNQFTFNNQSFSVKEIKHPTSARSIDNIVLDINSSWTKKEYDKLLKDLTSTRLWVSLDQKSLVRILSANQEQIWNQLKALNYNLIPFSEINPEQYIIVTKITEGSPSYKELDSSVYTKRIAKAMLTSSNPILCYNLASTSRDQFYNTFHDFGYLHLVNSTLDSAITDIRNANLPMADSNENVVRIEDANMCIVRQEADPTISQGGPDHLMRLYHYNKILQMVGTYYVENKNQAKLNQAVSMANEAFVVTPVSSLIVLETDKDYDQFGIDKNKNSLLNATKKGNGAVPEPHEWLLIGLGVLSMLYFIAKQKGLL